MAARPAVSPQGGNVLYSAAGRPVDRGAAFVSSRSLITTLYVVILSALGLGAGAVLLDTRAEYRRLKQAEAITRHRLAEAQARLREQEIVLARLRTDRDYVEKVIRQRLGYARPGEVIFRFED